jgi:hypothetical protein
LSADVDTSVPKWLEGTPYPLWRKRELQAKWDAIVDIDDPKHFMCKSFQKDEGYIAFKHARGINARSDEFKCMVGPIFKLIEEQVYQDHHFIKHIPVADRPKYITDLLYSPGGKYYAGDYTSFEALFVELLMCAVEFELYDYMTQHLPEGDRFRRLLRAVLAGDNVCNYRDFQVILKAVRMSGEMCTSLGNGFANLMFLLFIAQEKGSTHVDGVVEGDDSLFVMDGVTPTSEDFARLGLVIKLEEHEQLSTASFCGLVFDPTDQLNISDPLKILAAFGWTSQRYAASKDKTLRALLRCKALSLAHTYPGAPIISALAQYGLRVTSDVPLCKLRRLVNGREAMNAWERDRLNIILDAGNVPPVVSPINTRLLMA